MFKEMSARIIHRWRNFIHRTDLCIFPYFYQALSGIKSALIAPKETPKEHRRRLTTFLYTDDASLPRSNTN
jgi:hypothetical protein